MIDKQEIASVLLDIEPTTPCKKLECPIIKLLLQFGNMEDTVPEAMESAIKQQIVMENIISLAELDKLCSKDRNKYLIQYISMLPKKTVNDLAKLFKTNTMHLTFYLNQWKHTNVTLGLK